MEEPSPGLAMSREETFNPDSEARNPKFERRLQNPVNGGQGNGGKGIDALETDSFATIPLPPSAVLQSALEPRNSKPLPVWIFQAVES